MYQIDALTLSQKTFDYNTTLLNQCKTHVKCFPLKN